MPRYYYAADYDVHPQYKAYWVLRFTSRQERDKWQDQRNDRECLTVQHTCVMWAKSHNAFYDTGKMVPYTEF